MTVFYARPGVPLLVAPHVPCLFRPLSAPVVVVGGDSLPSDITGLTGWWDASGYAGIVGAGGGTVAGWAAAAYGVTDKSTSGVALVPFFGAGSGTNPLTTPRLSGILGGLGRNTVVPPGALPSAAQRLPVMDPDQGLRLPGPTFGAASSWTIFLTWSRPNWRQGASTAAIALLTIGAVPICLVDSSAGSGRLIVFGQTISGVTMARRHTHSLILSYSAPTGVGVWLDGSQVATGIANTITTPGVLTMLHDTTPAGSAQCWFHEAAYWMRALSGADITTLLSYATRWIRGTRRGINILVNGQSNAVFFQSDGGLALMAQGVAWYLGALAYNVLGTNGTTLLGGEALYTNPTDPAGEAGFGGSFLTYNSGTAPSTWALGSDGTGAESYVTGLAAAELSDCAAIFWPWSESDSGKAYTEKATFEAAQQRYIALMRGWVGQSAAVLPWLLWNAIPFQYLTPEPGNQMIREACYDQTQASAQNAWIVLPQTSDSISRSATPSADGTWTDNTTNPIHRSASDNVRYGQRAAIVAAQAILASSGGDTITSIPAGVPAVGGPVISHVYQQSSKVYIVTVTHDAGTDLVVPQQAAAGYGWSLMDGGTMATPGNLIVATACSYVSSTKVQVTFASAPVNAAAELLLFYPYGGMNVLPPVGGASPIGHGSGSPVTTNAVTDNLSALTPPAGWDIGNQLGTSWFQNLPLAATTYGVAVSTSP